MSAGSIPTKGVAEARAFGPFVVYPAAGARGGGEPERAPSWLDYGKLLWRRKLPVALMIALPVLCAYLISRRLPPVYEATATIDINRQAAPGLLGPEASNGAAPDMDQFIATQIRLAQSDAVLRPVAAKYQLLTLQAATPGQQRAAENAPVVLKNLKISRPPNTYLLQITYRHSNPQLAAQIANAIAASYLEGLQRTRLGAWATLSNFTDQQLVGLKAKMERSAGEQLNFERRLGMVDPEDKSNIVAARLSQLNADYARAIAERASKEAAYDAIRAGSAEAAQASPQGENLKKLVERRNDALEKFSEARGIFGENHPEYRRAQARLKEVDDQLRASRDSVIGRVEAEWKEARLREANLRREFAQAKSEADRLNASATTYRTLKQKADADRAFYQALANKAGEAEINATLENPGIRLADPARAPAKPVAPNILLNCAVVLLVSSLLAALAVMLLDGADKKLQSVEDVRAVTALEIAGVLPAAPGGRKLGMALESARYQEAVRMLRGAVLAQTEGGRVRTLLVAGPRGGEGRSTTAANLAVSIARLGRKVLLIDADLRRPALYRVFFSEPPELGLANVLKNEARWQDVVARQSGRPLLDLLPAGTGGADSPETLNAGIARVLEDAARHYDLVLIDAPPFLRFAETVEIARAVDSVLVIARANHTDRKDLEAILNYLERMRVDVAGIAVNDAAI